MSLCVHLKILCCIGSVKAISTWLGLHNLDLFVFFYPWTYSVKEKEKKKHINSWGNKINNVLSSGCLGPIEAPVSSLVKEDLSECSRVSEIMSHALKSTCMYVLAAVILLVCISTFIRQCLNNMMIAPLITEKFPHIS